MMISISVIGINCDIGYNFDDQFCEPDYNLISFVNLVIILMISFVNLIII